MIHTNQFDTTDKEALLLASKLFTDKSPKQLADFLKCDLKDAIAFMSHLVGVHQEQVEPHNGLELYMKTPNDSLLITWQYNPKFDPQFEAQEMAQEAIAELVRFLVEQGFFMDMTGKHILGVIK